MSSCFYEVSFSYVSLGDCEDTWKIIVIEAFGSAKPSVTDFHTGLHIREFTGTVVAPSFARRPVGKEGVHGELSIVLFVYSWRDCGLFFILYGSK